MPRHKRDDPNELKGGTQFHVDVLDTWNMTKTPVDRVFTIRKPAEKDYVVTDEEESSIDVPDKPWMALRITRVEALAHSSWRIVGGLSNELHNLHSAHCL